MLLQLLLMKGLALRTRSLSTKPKIETLRGGIHDGEESQPLSSLWTKPRSFAYINDGVLRTNVPSVAKRALKDASLRMATLGTVTLGFRTFANKNSCSIRANSRIKFRVRL